MILFFKSTRSETKDRLPPMEMLRQIYLIKVKQAKTEKDRERAERDLAEVQAGAGAAD
jgi:hypothetical protein